MNRPTILVVDDDRLVTDMLGMLLELSLEVEVITTNDPQKALEILAQKKVSLLLTDYLMPELNGLALVRRLRGTGSLIPAILLTGYCDEPELMAHGKELDPFEIIVKPWKNEYLLQRIRHGLSLNR